MPFSKPRFVLPTVAPDKLVDIYSSIDAWEHRSRKYYYRPEDYDDPVWLRSKLLVATFALAEQFSF